MLRPEKYNQQSGRVRGGGQQHVHESRPGDYLAAGNNWPDGRHSAEFTAAARTPKLGGVRADVEAVFADLKRPARHISYDDDFSVVVIADPAPRRGLCSIRGCGSRPRHHTASRLTRRVERLSVQQIHDGVVPARARCGSEPRCRETLNTNAAGPGAQAAEPARAHLSPTVQANT